MKFAATALYRVIVWLFVVVIGTTAVAWGSYTLPIFWRDAPIEHIGSYVIEGVPFKAEALATLIPAVEAVEQEGTCRPASVRAAAIIRLRIAEDSIAAGKQENIDGSLSLLRKSFRLALDCSPADSFLWLGLFWIENTVNGFNPRNLELLRMSYVLGPNEGWIGLKRNRMALAIFEQLPPDLAEMAIREFAALVNSGFSADMVSIFTGPGWHVRDQLLLGLKDISERYRRTFALLVYKQGFDVIVPGIKNPDPRPWH